MDGVRDPVDGKTCAAEGTIARGGIGWAMPIYVYETTDTSKPLRRFEVKQSMKDEPLKVDPKTGEPVRRVISGGYGVHVPGGSTGPSVGSVGSHSSGCDCC